ncbi:MULTISPECIES: 2,3-bisphosphoglycerate-dependent phosphoglycerate mutase [Leuconostoc]|jgi:2,3-bisphosphoglycerate-dependent phosphoglycerate mutase|uniref:2,3-bisphosphoglycerate-dependent phosphoglycerate mutase n=1 Tax=Leuconostoc TaxID=1243 RepID=UPI0011DE27C6|nr:MULTISPECIES: 2,3-bisphosphoglycerate-dependent phosphoglycerate mutase [Leuconostoc]MBK0041375.1 2,3-bisphosphoglycerate-dependent phosphoglycerate mutase [Leuconostoc sp. S51]MBK0052261.1 2,3-bisphosphoglycerate-dependent phosphoglycerate mutase [Leuconostoc sp. S50]MBS0957678.1 2,3-bisphosphoglycerate-dependent phosphoglycerate mutase [Leuconostoc pseudomesenteroides]MCT4379936.1 2,3-bisphosphoglycerate-dependent phosphoglycerate mutase [Leuconostoc pseudomesenteroides]MCT4413421.1 2,3-b
MVAKLVLVRHGESTANRDNEFTGWTDVPLTAKGKTQAHQVGQVLSRYQLTFDNVYTSYLQRAIITAYIIMDEMQQAWVPINKTWRLNERHYGALRGLNKDDAREKYGVNQVALWRRSYTAVPPLLEKVRPNRRYPINIEPRGESLKMASDRLIPYWTSAILPQLKNGENVLMVAHGSTLRALIKYIEDISDDDIDGLEIGNGEPILYEYDTNFSERHYLK